MQESTALPPHLANLDVGVFLDASPGAWTPPPPPLSNTSVYLPGLQPDTNEAWLFQYGTQHGHVNDVRILSRKRDTRSVAGRIRYATEQQARNCIIHAREQLGLDAWFSRFQFSTEMKWAADPSSTNLYLSNLPLHWDESHLREELFASDEYEVRSCRVLRENDRSGLIVQEHEKGPSRGVGFARLATRAQCELAIEQLNGTYMFDQYIPLPLQVRFADSEAQRHLKAAMSLQNMSSYTPAIRGPRPIPIKTPPRPIYNQPAPAPPMFQASSWPGAVNPMLFLPQFATPPHVPACMPPPVPHSPIYAHSPIAYAHPPAGGFVPPLRIPIPPDSPVMMMMGPPSPESPLMFRMPSLDEMGVGPVTPPRLPIRRRE